MNVTGKTGVLGVWGHPVGHSRSPAMHNAALRAMGKDWLYAPFDVKPENVKAAVAGIRALGIIGVNVTVPLKEIVLPFLDDIDERASQIGSVNTIHNDDGILRGYSTDGAGFLSALAAEGEAITNRHVYLWGAGGSARAVAFSLAASSNRVVIANRTRSRALELAACVNGFYPESVSVAEWGEFSPECDVFVQTTSVGMTPDIHASPPIVFGPEAFVFDLVYAPIETKLLRTAREMGCRRCNGLGMLVRQGALSLSIWAGVPLDEIPISVMESAAQNR